MKLAIVLIFFVQFAGPLAGQGRTVVPRGAGNAAAIRRHALVIGNKDYTQQPLVNPVNDATDLAETLRASGFTVTLKTNLRRDDMDGVLAAYSATLNAGDSALVYFSGHGLEVQGQNYLLPVDFAADAEYQVRSRALNSTDILDALKARGVAVSILILDACRNNPFKGWARAQGGGLAPLHADGAYIAFAAAPGQVASDNRGGRNGLFTKHLKEVIAQPGLSINDVFDQVRERVLRESTTGQRPFSTTGLVGRFFFREGQPAAGAASPAQPPVDVAIEAWNEVKESRSVALLEGYVKEFPNSQYAGLARVRLTVLKEQQQQPAPAPVPAAETGRPGATSGRASLGVVFRGTADGLAITRITQNGPAMRAGMRVGDEILALGGAAVQSPTEAKAALERFEVGDTLLVQARRLDQAMEFQVKLADRDEEAGPANGPAVPSAAAPVSTVGNRVGAESGGGDSRSIRRGTSGRAVLGLSYASSATRPQVQRINPLGPSGRAGIRQGDELMSIAGKTVVNSDSIPSILQEQEVGESVTVLVRRNGQLLEYQVKLADRDEVFRGDQILQDAWLAANNNDGVKAAEKLQAAVNEGGENAGTMELQAYLQLYFLNDANAAGQTIQRLAQSVGNDATAGITFRLGHHLGGDVSLPGSYQMVQLRFTANRLALQSARQGDVFAVGRSEILECGMNGFLGSGMSMFHITVALPGGKKRTYNLVGSSQNSAMESAVIVQAVRNLEP